VHSRTTASLQVETKLFHLDLKCYHRDLGLCNIRAIERVETICAENSSLHLFYRLLRQIFHEIAVIENLLVDFLDHHFECLVTVTATETMEVKVKELKLVLLFILMDVSDVLCCNAHLSGRVVAQQVDDVARSIGVHNVIEMQCERLFGHLSVSRQVYFLGKTPLLPEHWYRASDLNMTYEVAITHDHNLLSLTAVGDIALIVDSTGVVARSRPMPHPSRDQRQLGFKTIQIASSLGEVALDQRSEPSDIHLLPDKVSVKGKVPEVLVVAGDEFQRLSALLLHPAQSSLS